MGEGTLVDVTVKTENYSTLGQGDEKKSTLYITSFEEAAVSLSGAIRIVKTCQQYLQNSGDTDSKLCVKIQQTETIISETNNVADRQNPSKIQSLSETQNPSEIQSLSETQNLSETISQLCLKLSEAEDNLSEASLVLEEYISAHAGQFAELDEVKFDINNFIKADQHHAGESNHQKYETDFKKYDMKIESSEVDNSQEDDSWEDKYEDDETDASAKSKTDSQKYKCTECSYTAKKSSNLKTHVEAKHRSNMYSCDLCSFTTTTLAYLKVHTHKHTVMTEKRHYCDICHQSFNRKSRLQHHISVIHQGKRLNCKECDYTCKYHSNLQEHINRIHKGIEFKCHICEYKTGSDKNLKVHISASHETGEFHCRECEYIGQSKTRLQYHVNRYIRNPF
jgi:hypothetical protein